MKRDTIKTVLKRQNAFVIGLSILFFSNQAFAYNDGNNVLDLVIDKYMIAIKSWAPIMTQYSTRLYIGLCTLSFIWLMLKKAFEQPSFEMLAWELLRNVVRNGLFYFLLIKSPEISSAIITSFKSIGLLASGNPKALSPNKLVDLAFEIFNLIYKDCQFGRPFDSAISIIMGLAILLILVQIATNQVLALINGWVLAYGGIFLVGFGGSDITSDIAKNYYKIVLAVAVNLMALVLLTSIGQSILTDFYISMDKNVSVKQICVMLVVTTTLYNLVNKVPSMLSSIVTGANIAGVDSGPSNLNILRSSGAMLAQGATRAYQSYSFKDSAVNKAANAASQPNNGD